MKRTTACFLAAMTAFASAAYATDIFVAPEGRGEMTGADWSNALKGTLEGYSDVRAAIVAAVADGATEVNVYFAGGSYTITNQISLSSIAIPVKLSGGYLAETDGSFDKGETATTFARSTYNIRFIAATSLSALRIEGITFSGGYVSYGGAKGGAVYLSSSTAVISNCVFSGNTFSSTTKDSRNGSVNYLGGGGAVAAMGPGSLEVDACTFANNRHAAGGSYNHNCGGAVLGYNVALNVRNSTFRNNYMNGGAGRNTLFGAAMGTYYGNVSISNCTFSANYIVGAGYDPGGSSGGALAIRDAVSFKMADSTLAGNYVANSTGMTFPFTAGILLMDDWNASDGLAKSVVERCVFDSRTAPQTTSSRNAQSDILLTGGQLFMTNCLVFASKGAGTYGDYAVRNVGSIAYSGSTTKYYGYIYSAVTCAPSYMELVNCTIADGQKYGVAAVDSAANISLKNCIAWGNSVSGVVNAASIEYSCIQEPHDGAGNFVADPHGTGAPYYHLLTKRAGGAITDGWFGGTYNSPKTEKNSPCLDVGAPGSAGLDLEPHPHGRHVNLGAYGGTPWASKTLSPPATMLFAY